MSIENDMARIATALELIARNTAPGAAPAEAPAAHDAAAPSTEKRGRGRPPAVKTTAASPAITPAAPEAPAAPVEPETPAAPVVVTDREADDDFMGARAAEPPATIEDVRAALHAYAARQTAAIVAAGEPAGEAANKAGKAKARALLKHLSGVDNLTAFTDKTMYSSFVKSVNTSK